MKVNCKLVGTLCRVKYWIRHCQIPVGGMGREGKREYRVACISHPRTISCGKNTEMPAGKGQLKCDGTRAETRFRLSRKTDESI